MRWLIILLILQGCGGSDSGSASSDGSPEAICTNNKEVFDVWTSQTDGTIYDMRAGAYDVPLVIKFGGGACDSGRGDFKMTVNSDKSIDFVACDGVTTLDAGTFFKQCDVLTINYDDGSEESFD